MLKKVRYIDYQANYDYAPPEGEAVINTDEVVSAVEVKREYTRRPFDDIMRVHFRDGKWLDVLGKPSDLLEGGEE